MSENDEKERNVKHFLRDLIILLVPFAIVYILYLLFFK
jgi:hypothetical protein